MISVTDESTTDVDELKRADGSAIYHSAMRLWAAAQEFIDPRTAAHNPNYGQGVREVRDVQIAADTTLDIGTVRAWLRVLDNKSLVVKYDGPNLHVIAPMTYR